MTALEKLQELADEFRADIRRKNWTDALQDYKIAIMMAAELSENDRNTVFGIREDKGRIAQEGWFREYDVVDVFDMVTFGHMAYREQKRKEEMQERMKKKRERGQDQEEEQKKN